MSAFDYSFTDRDGEDCLREPGYRYPDGSGDHGDRVDDWNRRGRVADRLDRDGESWNDERRDGESWADERRETTAVGVPWASR